MSNRRDKVRRDTSGRRPFHSYNAMYASKLRQYRSGTLFRGDTSCLSSPEEFYLKAGKVGDFMKRLMCGIELAWYRNMRPYYKVWPSLVPVLVNTSIDIDGSALCMPSTCISIRLPVGNELEGAGLIDIDSFLVGLASKSEHDKEPGTIFVSVQSGGDWIGVVQVPLNGNIQRTLDHRFRDSSSQQDTDLIDLKTISTNVLRLAVAVLLLSEDPSIIEPEVLAKDEFAYLSSGNPKYVDKAKRRGVHGFNIGRQCEVMPHTRRPHFAIRWMGKGKGTTKVPRLRAIKGSIVHRKLMTQVPTGYITPNNVEVEP